MGKVNRCICSNISFEKIKSVAEERGLSTVKELQQHQICACDCMLCAPYIKKMLKLGETEFVPVSMDHTPDK